MSFSEETSLERLTDPKLALDFDWLLGSYGKKKSCREKKFCHRFHHLRADWTFRPSKALGWRAERAPAVTGTRADDNYRWACYRA